MGRLRSLAAVSLMAAGIAACGTQPAETESKVLIVATTSILGDVVGNLVGTAARVETIMPVGADPHDFEASARQAELIHEADLVVANGLGLEEGLLDVIEAAEADGANVLELAPLLDPIPFGDEHAAEEDHAAEAEEHGHGEDDPHFWQDPVRMAQAVRLIGQRLAELDTGVSSTEWQERADTYAAEVLDVHAEVESILAVIPAGRRKLVTNHEALGYFAERYGFEVIGVVIPGGSTLAEPSAGELAELVEEIEHEGVQAIFVENTNPSVLAEAVAAELGREVSVIELTTDSLGQAGTPAETYLGMIVGNARIVAEALG